MRKMQVPLTLESKAFGDAGEFSGYASIFGNVDQGDDVVLPGAFKEFETNDEGNVVVLWSHSKREPLGVAKVEQDERGLKFAGQLVMEDPQARAIRAHMKAGSVRGMSIGYDVLPGGAKMLDSGVRQLSALKLWEISPVTFAMNQAARVSDVKAVEEIQTIRDLEDHLRDAGGFSRNQAKALSLGGFKALQDLRDAGNDGDESMVALAMVRNLIALHSVSSN